MVYRKIHSSVLHYENSTCETSISDFKVGTCMWSNVHIARTEVDKRPGLISHSYLIGWFIFQMRAPLLAFPGMRRVLNSDQPHARYIKYIKYSRAAQVVHMYGTEVCSVSNFQLPWYRKFACD